MKTVAIVGSHTRTRDAAPWYEYSKDVWLFNEAVSIGWPKRANAVFQMHKEAVWKNPLNRNDRRFAEWIKDEHPFPIYMLDRYPEVPASVKYPLDEVCGELLVGFTKGGDTKRYFTSTVAYAIALALYQGYERIELYGVEMESNTEYTYQRDGVFFWLGIALGRGVEVEIHAEANLFSELLYGYEGDVVLKREHFIERKEFLEAYLEQAKKDLDDANARQQQALDLAMEQSGGEPELVEKATVKAYTDSIKLQAQAVVDWGMFEGAISECDRYLAKADAMTEAAGEYIFARQEFELTGAQALDLRDQRQAQMQVMAATAQSAWKNLEVAITHGMDQRGRMNLAEKYAHAHQDYLKATFEFGRLSGIYQENLTLLAKMDELIKAAGGEKAAEALLQSKNGRTKRSRSRKREKAKIQ